MGGCWQDGENYEQLIYIFNFNHHLICQHNLVYSSGSISLQNS